MRVLSIGLLALALASPAAAEPMKRPPALKIALGGDVYIDAPTRNGLKRRAATIGAAAAYRELLEEVAPALRGADLAIVNLETPIAPRHYDRGPGDPPIFNATKSFLDALVDAGVDAVTLANNHAYDQGLRGLRETLAAIGSTPLAVAGVGQTAAAAPGPAVMKTRAGDVAICAWTQSVNVRPFDEPDDDGPTDGVHRVALTRDGSFEPCLRRAKSRSSLAIAALHFTTSAWAGPGPSERALAKAAVAAGADLVIGHGPHVPGPASWIEAADGRRVLVIYSLGNLVGAMSTEHTQWRRRRAGVRDAPVLVVDLERAPSGRLAARSLGLHPFWITDEARRLVGWPEGQPLTRPLSISREIERLALTACGERCDRRRALYRRRADALARAFALDDRPPRRLALTVAGEARGAETAFSEGAPAPAAVVASAAALEAPRAAAPSPEVEAPRDAAPRPEPPPATTPEPQPEPLGTDNVIVLPLTFASNRVTPDVADEEALSDIVERLRAERSTRIVLTGFARPDEDLMEAERFGARRARAAMWLLAGRGPSRSRFEIHGAPPSANARVELTLRPAGEAPTRREETLE